MSSDFTLEEMEITPKESGKQIAKAITNKHLALSFLFSLGHAII